MNYEHIESFLAIIANGSISAAADVLYVSQSTISTRIQQLEEELGVSLLVRKKGHKNIELTCHGELFVPIANQWSSLLNDTKALSLKPDIRKLSIASVDAINNYTFTNLFNKYLEEQPDTRLEIGTYHSNEIHKLVENKTVDIGFVFSSANYPDLISKPVYRELMYLICHKDSKYYDNITCSELDVSNEIFLNWGPDYKRWHDRNWSPYNNPLITVNTGSLLQHYLHVPNRWAIGPMSVIEAFKQKEELVYYKIQDGPSPRICYQITSRFPNPARIESIKLFEEKLELFIKNESTICIYEDWMKNSDHL